MFNPLYYNIYQYIDQHNIHDYILPKVCFPSSMEMWHEVNVTPSEPRYFQYTFKKDQTQVVVRVHSPDDFCMVVSVQDVEVSRIIYLAQTVLECVIVHAAARL